MNSTVKGALLFVGLAALVWALLVLAWRLARWAIILSAWIIVFAVASGLVLWSLLATWSPQGLAWLRTRAGQTVRAVDVAREADAA